MDDNDIALQVIQDLHTRRTIGHTRYGHGVSIDDERDFLWETYEELLDAAIYLRTEIARRDRKKKSWMHSMMERFKNSYAIPREMAHGHSPSYEQDSDQLPTH